jgi:glycerol-3-phosphate dehydrogenase
LQVAVSNLSEAVQDADLLVFVIPHQFIHRICNEITGQVPKKALGITLIKVSPEPSMQEAHPGKFTSSPVCLQWRAGGTWG